MLTGKIWENGTQPEEKILFDRDVTETICLGHVTVKCEESTTLRTHDDEEEIYVILKGKAMLLIGDEEQEVGPGDVAYVPRNHQHKFTCISEEKLEYLYFANWPKA